MERTRQNLDAVRQVKAWILAATQPPEGALAVAIEVVCPQPGCPPIETMTALMLPSGDTLRRKLPFPVAEVTEAVVVAAWADHA